MKLQILVCLTLPNTVPELVRDQIKVLALLVSSSAGETQDYFMPAHGIKEGVFPVQAHLAGRKTPAHENLFITASSPHPPCPWGIIGSLEIGTLCCDLSVSCCSLRMSPAGLQDKPSGHTLLWELWLPWQGWSLLLALCLCLLNDKVVTGKLGNNSLKPQKTPIPPPQTQTPCWCRAHSPLWEVLLGLKILWVLLKSQFSGVWPLFPWLWGWGGIAQCLTLPSWSCCWFGGIPWAGKQVPVAVYLVLGCLGSEAPEPLHATLVIAPRYLG